MKKMISFICIMALIMSLVACGVAQPSEQAPTTVPVTDSAPTDGETVTEPPVPDSTESPSPPVPDTTEPSEEETEPHSHSYSVALTDATCTKNGQKVYTCECGDRYSEEISAKGHNYKVTTRKPTCSKEGGKVYTCACGDSYMEDTVPTTPHTWGDWKVHRLPTTKSDGEQRRPCINCKEYQTGVLTRIPTEEELLVYANMLQRCICFTVGGFPSMDEMSESELKQIAFVAANRLPQEDSMTWRFQVSDLNDFCLRSYGRTLDWSACDSGWNETYDPETDTVSVFCYAAGDELEELDTVQDNGDGTYTIYADYGYGRADLVLQLTEYGYKILSYT